MRNVNWKRRNICAAAILALYFAVNALAIGFSRLASPIQVDHYQDTVGEATFVLRILLIVLFFATSWFWARAKNWPGFVGTIAALGGVTLWFGCVLAAIAPYVGRDMTGNKPSIPMDNWLALLPWVAFTFTAIILKVIPVRKTAATQIADAA